MSENTGARLVLRCRLVPGLTNTAIAEHEPGSVSLTQRRLLRDVTVAVGNAGARCRDDGRHVTAGGRGRKRGETDGGSVTGDVVDTHG